jgi:hypothetical protein
MGTLPTFLSRLLLGAVLLSGCGGGTTDPGNDDADGNNNNNNSGSPFSATIDGQAWSVTGATAVTAIQFAPQSGGYMIIATGTGVIASISLTLNFIVKTGTYPLGVDGATVPGGFAGVTVGTGGVWLTPFSGAAGSITITTLTTTRIAGTFSFTTTGSSGGATGTKVVTQGRFDLPMNAAPIAVLTDSMGSTLSASLNGQPWNGAIVSGQTTATHLSLLAINNLQSLTLTIPRPAGTGTYQLSNNPGSILWATDPNAVAPAGTRCCYGILGDVGTLTITSLTTTRIKGTFSATLRPQPGTAATGSLIITNGAFDIGLYHSP